MITTKEYIQILKLNINESLTDEQIIEKTKTIFGDGYLIDYISKTNSLNKLNDSQFNEKIIVNGIEHHYRHINKLTVAEWCDLENLLAREIDNLHRIASVLYAPLKKEYNGSMTYANEMLVFDFSKIKVGVEKYISERNKLIKNYPNIYKFDIEEEEDEKNIISLGFQNNEKLFFQKYKWYTMVYAAANKEYLKINEVLKSNAIEFLFHTNFTVEEAQINADRINSAMKKNNKK